MGWRFVERLEKRLKSSLIEVRGNKKIQDESFRPAEEFGYYNRKD
jgi:hypothetical protein